MANLAQLLYMEMKSTPTARSTLKMGIHSNTLHSFNFILYLETKQILFTEGTFESQKTLTTCGHTKMANLYKKKSNTSLQNWITSDSLFLPEGTHKHFLYAVYSDQKHLQLYINTVHFYQTTDFILSAVRT
jgi:hypothetical protein